MGYTELTTRVAWNSNNHNKVTLQIFVAKVNILSAYIFKLLMDKSIQNRLVFYVCTLDSVQIS